MDRKTNKQAKREAIKIAWGDAWEQVKSDVREDGSIRSFENIGDKIYWHTKLGFKPQHMDTIFSAHEHDRFRPKSLVGIENNRGWIRIEPDGSNLPSTGNYKCYLHGNEFECFLYPTRQWIRDNSNEVFPTHFRPIKKDDGPVY